MLVNKLWRLFLIQEAVVVQVFHNTLFVAFLIQGLFSDRYRACVLSRRSETEISRKERKALNLQTFFYYCFLLENVEQQKVQ